MREKKTLDSLQLKVKIRQDNYLGRRKMRVVKKKEMVDSKLKEGENTKTEGRNG